MTKTKKVKQPVKKEQYKAILNVLGRLYEANGDSPSDAISKLKPQNCKGRGILIVERGSVRKERILMPSITFRLFNSTGLSRQVALKNASILFDGI